MTAKDQMLQYAQDHNDGKTLTNEEFCGMMITEGVVINRTPNSKTTARATRTGRTIKVIETTVTTTHEIKDGKVIDIKAETSKEIFSVDF